MSEVAVLKRMVADGATIVASTLDPELERVAQLRRSVVTAELDYEAAEASGEHMLQEPASDDDGGPAEEADDEDVRLASIDKLGRYGDQRGDAAAERADAEAAEAAEIGVANPTGKVQTVWGAVSVERPAAAAAAAAPPLPPPPPHQHQHQHHQHHTRTRTSGSGDGDGDGDGGSIA